MLTAEYVDACKVDDVEDLKRRGLDVADVSKESRGAREGNSSPVPVSEL